jgi:hypothetical protein
LVVDKELIVGKVVLINKEFYWELEHLKIKTRLINEMFTSVMGEYVLLK